MLLLPNAVTTLEVAVTVFQLTPSLEYDHWAVAPDSKLVKSTTPWFVILSAAMAESTLKAICGAATRVSKVKVRASEAELMFPLASVCRT